jgi:LPS export ABC transporter protein LptC
MNKKSGLQVVMIFFIIIISFWFYLKYFTNNLEDAKEVQVKEKVNEEQSSDSTYFNDINYTSIDFRGNKYQITAKLAEIKIENSDVMFLTDVIAFVFIKDKDTVKITSNFGKYNTINYDTIFSENVIVVYPDHKITGEYLDFSFLTNLGIFTTNVIYTGEKTNLFADKIEMNLTTKDTKIFMNNVGEKVLIEGTE